ncbi:hypothetical protein BKA66DRAFT_601595 [Pyrenochaeta sp. MPI-SDFR-AT-0127]|nr:hypothetical protein BKA66DRAFT_601595 [Pyrenochaeta sp. MPI-SDFR-AT-0127]
MPMAVLKTLPFLLVSLAAAVPASFEEGTSLEPRANNWWAHAKFYAWGGKIGNEIYISGTWSSPQKVVGEDSGPCSAQIGSIGESTAFDVNCACRITGDGPLRFTSTCFLDFSLEPSYGAAGFSIAFDCTAFSSCTGTNAYYVNSGASQCDGLSGNSPCAGFRTSN